jgi:hypothetical protein
MASLPSGHQTPVYVDDEDSDDDYDPVNYQQPRRRVSLTVHGKDDYSVTIPNMRLSPTVLMDRLVESPPSTTIASVRHTIKLGITINIRETGADSPWRLWFARLAW